MRKREPCRCGKTKVIGSEACLSCFRARPSLPDNKSAKRAAPWSNEELDLVEKHYSFSTLEELLKLLPYRSAKAVRQRAGALGLRRGVAGRCEVAPSFLSDRSTYSKQRKATLTDKWSVEDPYAAKGDKLCAKCKVTQPVQNFGICRSTIDGLYWWCRACHNTYQVILKYGRSLEEGDSCEMCGSKEKLCIDHCHTSGRVRGVLCSPCNFTLGHARDRVDVLEAGIRYLKSSYSLGDE